MKALGQQFIIGVQGTELSNDEAHFIVTNNIGGVILFSRNYESPKQLHTLCSQIQSLKDKQESKAPLFIGIDMEGGRVQRLKAPFTQWPALKNIGDLGSTSLAFKFSQMMGLELRAMGINLNFAPCTDILTNPKNEVIGDRALSSDPQLVAKMASALVRGYIKSKIIPCAKHFPGHGNTLFDSHEKLPVEDIDLETLNSREIIPFKKVLRARLDMIMTSHILFSKIDPEWPTTLSKIFLKKMLREELRFLNLIITDDLDMRALRNEYSVEQIAVRALEAGNDILLYCNEPESHKQAFETAKKAVTDGKLNPEELLASQEKILATKKTKLEGLTTTPFNEAAQVINHPDHLALAKAIQEGVLPEKLPDNMSTT